MTDRNRPIEELEAELRSRGATFHASDDFDEEMRESFLRHVLAFDEEPETTIRQELAARGRDIAGDLWALIGQFAELNIVLERTDHLDDAALFEFLLGYLDEPVYIPGDPNTIMHVDLLGGGSEEDQTLFLRYYASDEDRELWKREFPREKLPARERRPYDRDRLLPTAEEVREAVSPKRGARGEMGPRLWDL
jgi:plasmid stability protein